MKYMIATLFVIGLIANNAQAETVVRHSAGLQNSANADARIDRRIESQRNRIDRLEDKNRLSSREADALDERLDRLDARADRFDDNGLNAREYHKLDQQLDANGRRIYREGYDGNDRLDKRNQDRSDDRPRHGSSFDRRPDFYPNSGIRVGGDVGINPSTNLNGTANVGTNLNTETNAVSGITLNGQ